MSRTLNSKRNIVSGILFKLFATLLPFAIRTAIIYFLGTEYLGVTSLFTSILSVLSLTELGFSSAIVYSMYKPIAEDDECYKECIKIFKRMVKDDECYY